MIRIRQTKKVITAKYHDSSVGQYRDLYYESLVLSVQAHRGSSLVSLTWSAEQPFVTRPFGSD